jgi:DNA-binding response OmpR family regulator
MVGTQSTAPGAPAPAPPSTVTVLVYSDDAAVREQIRLALGRRVAADLPELTCFECATEPAVISALDKMGKDANARVDLVILDGEAVPAGGMGIARQLKDEIYDCPPLLVLTGRAQDGWLATWARADAILPHPIDPVRLAELSASLLRGRLG